MAELKSQHSKHLALRICLTLYFLLSVGQLALGQYGVPPKELELTLQQRLSLFTSAQSEGRWDIVEPMLGPYRGMMREQRMSPNYKQCLISQMKMLPMTAFTIKNYLHSSGLNGLPLEKWWWFLEGDAVYKSESSGELKQRAQIIAYRYKGEWYFTPPNYDRLWEKQHYSEVSSDKNYSDEINVLNLSEAPVEIVDLHVAVDPKSPYQRKLTFRVFNRSVKKISAYTLVLKNVDNSGSQLYGTPTAIEPGAKQPEKMDDTRYVFFCDGIQKSNLIVQDVSFADGSEWVRPDPKAKSKRKR